MRKELSVKQALLLLAEKYPEPVEGYVSSGDAKFKTILTAVWLTDNIYHFQTINMGRCSEFYIEVPDEYRYMTQQEYSDWLVIIGYKNNQIRFKGSTWKKPNDIPAHCFPQEYEYRTIQEIDGKIVYSEPMEFKVKV